MPIKMLEKGWKEWNRKSPDQTSLSKPPWQLSIFISKEIYLINNITTQYISLVRYKKVYVVLKQWIYIFFDTSFSLVFYYFCLFRKSFWLIPYLTSTVSYAQNTVFYILVKRHDKVECAYKRGRWYDGL